MLTVGRLGNLNAGCTAKEYRPVMGADEFLLRKFVSDQRPGPLFLSCDSEAAKLPLVKGAHDPMLHLAFGNLKTNRRNQERGARYVAVDRMV